MSKPCTKCKEVKPYSGFHKNNGNNDGYGYHCKACRKEESLKTYGLTLAVYDELVEEQDGRCKICRTDTPGGTSTSNRWYVDHNHKTGKVRGLLCTSCNTGIGLFKDSTRVLALAIAYLEEEGQYGE